jgi:hypothetical protein
MGSVYRQKGDLRMAARMFMMAEPGRTLSRDLPHRDSDRPRFLTPAARQDFGTADPRPGKKIMPPAFLRFRAPARLCLAFALALPAFAQWTESKSDHYSVFYQSGYEKDLAFARTWLDRGEALLQKKYGVPFSGYHVDVYLYPEPRPEANTGTANLKCCSGTAKTGVISFLAPSAPVWKDFHGLTSLHVPKDENYQAKVLMSEYITVGHYIVQDARANSSAWRYYSAPDWFVQGLQEYDGIFHTTDANRQTTGAALLAWAGAHSAVFQCCDSGLTISNVYNGGAAFVTFLAAQFGEDIHARLLRDESPTFAAALENHTKPDSLPELYAKFQAWLAAPKAPAH